MTIFYIVLAAFFSFAVALFYGRESGWGMLMFLLGLGLLIHVLTQ